MNKNLLVLPLVALFAACGSKKKTEETVVAETAPVVVEETVVIEEQHGLVISNMDVKVRPQDDFFRYVNGAWLDNAEIPADQGSWGSFNELRETNNAMVLKVLEDAAASGNYVEGSDQRKAADFYAVGMDSLLAEQKRFSPLDEIFAKINAIENAAGLQEYMAYQTKIGGNAFLGFSIFSNLSDSKVNAAYIGQDGLGLPDNDYYLKTDEKSVEVQTKYKAHIAKMLGLYLGEQEGLAEKAEAIYELEYQMATVSMNSTEQRNIEAQNNPMSLTEIEALSSSIDWNKYLTDLGVSDVDTMIVMQPDFVAEMSKIFDDANVQLWKDYLTWNVLNNFASTLHSEIVATDFEFYGKTLRGTEENRPRWKRMLGATNGAMGEAIGKLYVDAVFPAEAKETAKAMVDNILLAMEARINNVDWMTAETKVKAVEKLNSFTVKIGYPDTWKDYSSLEVKRGTEDASFSANVIAARMWSYEEQLAKLHLPVDRAEWHMSPQTVNAYYSPLNNEIVFPAAILQPPFFDFKADAPVNFGGIGAVIGHEISHGFDDKGSQFDKDGNFSNWWTDVDREQFTERGQKLIEQFDTFEPLDSLHINGQLTLGENIGDLGGVNLAWDGLQMYFEANGKTEVIDGFTPEERFFMSWATIWRTKYRDESLRSQILTNPHAPGHYRAFAPLTNVDAFYTTFDLKEGDKMYRKEEDRVKIW